MTDTDANPLAWLPADAAAAAMDAHRIIAVDGPDAEAFLQGQFSNDITSLAASPGQLSSYNSPKGRVLAFLRIMKREDGFRLVIDEAIADAVIQRLRMFVLRSRVDIGNEPELIGRVIAGPGIDAWLAKAGLPCPSPGEAVAKNGCILLAIPGPVPRVELYGAPHDLPSLHVETASADDLARWDILFGLPRIQQENQDTHVAQHLNLDELGAISFRKGCYTGQEIIARMKYLGKVKKRAKVYLGNGAKTGDAVRNEEEKTVGEIVNVAPANDKQLMLATVNLDDQDSPLQVNGNPLARIKSNGQD